MDLQTQVEKKLCEDEHLYFTRRFFKPRMGFKFMVNWHHQYVAWLIDEVIKGNIANLVINVPPGAGKTELTTNLIPRGLALNARSRFLYLSFSQSLVEGVSDTARDIVKSKDFQAMWNLQVSNSTDSKKEWKITVDDYDVGHIYVASMGGQVTGRRAGTLAEEGFTGCIIIDDPLKPEDVFSKIKRDSANRKILNTVNSRKAKSDTPIIMIMQRLHVEDPTHFVMTGNLPGDWEQVSIPALIDDAYINTLPEHIQKLVPRDVERDEKGRQSYWPQKETLKSLLQLEKGGQDKEGATVSRYTFSSQYMQQPKKLGGDLIKAEWFGTYKELPPLQWRAIWADTAQKTKEHNDYSVFLCGGLGYDDKFYIIDVRRGKWLAPELIQEAELFIKKHHVDTPALGALRYMAIEDKASGTTLIQTISRTASIPIRAIQRNTDKLTRTMDVQFYVEDGRVMLPVDAPWLSPYVEEVEGLTADMTHDHDDQWDPTIDGINDTLATPPSLLD
ncbi:helicase [Acinetobacter sp. ANC 4216]|uniref:phage terminase large subunit n=1 Tax=Acinetobacter sp. ANC 4216 TaxID=2529840 RepID=UPI001040B7B1|nr:phage terminase large subunit [Acinetobacter sp. ANC 4216]TCB67403.1 helicase [Acinetobacter sp. ANC 4216]